MASTVDVKMDSQEVPNSATEHREGGVATNTDPTKPSNSEATPSTSAPEPEKKASISQDTKRNSKGKSSKQHGDRKSKKGKKNRAVAEESSSNDGADDIQRTSSSSDELDGSNPGPVSEQNVKRKRLMKRRQGTYKAKKEKSTKKSRKQYFSDSSTSASDDSGSDIDDSDLDSMQGRQKQKTKLKFKELQQQVQQLQLQLLQLQPPGAGLPPPGGSFPVAGMPPPRRAAPGLNNGYVGNSFLGSAGLGTGGLADTGFNPAPAEFDDDVAPLLGRGGFVPAFGSRRLGGQRLPFGSGSRLNSGLSGLDDDLLLSGGESKSGARLRRHGSRPQRLDFKRVDQVWDSRIHDFKLQDTAANADESAYDEYLFHVRRTFDWEGKYKSTIVDVKSKQLREALQDIIGNINGVSLVEKTPKLNPNLLFLYLEDLREHMHNLKDLEPDAKTKKERKKIQKWINEKRSHLKVLIKYLDKDYAQIKESLYPLLDSGLITYDLCWALWKPNTLAYTTTYGSHDEPRVFKVEVAEKHFALMKGDFYYIEGKYFEYDGKQFGYGSLSEEIKEFTGTRKITSLNCYPLKYHKNETQLRQELIERGKKFVSLAGVKYKAHQGMAYYKKKKSVVKVNINGRIIVDPATHRRSNPNYPVSLVRPKDSDVLSDDEDSDDDQGGCCECDSDSDGGDEESMRYVTAQYRDKNGEVHTLRIPKDQVDAGAPGAVSQLDKVQSKDEKNEEHTPVTDEDSKSDTEKKTPEFTDEEYLIASAVVLGFAFSEKLWLEFTVSGVKEISWNEGAYESLVLEEKTKSIVKALVESHKYHAAESIDDVIQGKGKGLVAVLHGPPGTGKTLTAEGISELLKCPLYCVSAGDLGTDSRYLESELQKILDICHAWGAILLLDEADVFLEKRNMHDIHRNALVSIFLRQLEYFQGILFLTTNRVETFDDAFQSRIHIALRYGDLDAKAKRAVFKMFIERVRALDKMEVTPFNEEDYISLARHNLNGRQIKNTVRTAQALAVNRKEPLGMKHLREVLEAHMTFERDLKGGSGYEDAMRGYM